MSHAIWNEKARIFDKAVAHKVQDLHRRSQCKEDKGRSDPGNASGKESRVLDGLAKLVVVSRVGIDPVEADINVEPDKRVEDADDEGGCAVDVLRSVG